MRGWVILWAFLGEAGGWEGPGRLGRIKLRVCLPWYSSFALERKCTQNFRSAKLVQIYDSEPRTLSPVESCSEGMWNIKEVVIQETDTCRSGLYLNPAWERWHDATQQYWCDNHRSNYHLRSTCYARHYAARFVHSISFSAHDTFTRIH